MFDTSSNVWRVRELSRDPLPTDRLRWTNEREAKATALVDALAVLSLDARVLPEGRLLLTGQVKDGPRPVVVTAQIDIDERLRAATCECSYFIRNRLHRGPCEHILAIRIAHARRDREGR